MNYKEFKIGKLEIYFSSTIRINGFDFEILPRLTYQKYNTHILITRAVIMSWLIFYASISFNKNK